MTTKPPRATKTITLPAELAEWLDQEAHARLLAPAKLVEVALTDLRKKLSTPPAGLPPLGPPIPDDGAPNEDPEAGDFAEVNP